MAYSLKKVYYIAKELSLDDWWVLSVIIEYFDCRQYAENNRVWTFDFDKPSQQDIKTIPEKKVVIPGYTLTQNIRPGDLSTRASFYNEGLPVVTLEDADLIPEGLVNNTGFPGIKYSIDAHDSKLAFANKALILEDKFYYQWDIGEITNYYKHKSDPLDSSKFFEIVDRLSRYQNLLMIKQSDQHLETDIEDAYKELEKARAKLRQKILDYHNDKKKDLDTSQANVPEPPALLYFDSVKLTKGVYQIQTQMAPVFLRSAVKNLQRAEKARERLDLDPEDRDALLDELEHSAVCITSAVNCLESYINFLIDRYLMIKLDRKPLKEKWRCFPKLLGLPFRFDENKPLYRDFSAIVDCRNETVHHKSNYAEVEGGASRTYSQLNMKNAKTAVRVARDMITKLSEEGTIPLPAWIKTEMGSADYWDIVPDYLKKI